MAIDATKIFSDLEGHAMRSGYFTNVNGHEPKSPAVLADQINLFFWSGPLQPVLSSGLNMISFRWEIIARTFTRADSEPGDAIDPAVVTATLAFVSSLAAAFSLNEQVRHVDFYGSDGEQLSATPGYYDYGDATYRCMDITIPLVINDVMAVARG